MTRTAQQHYKPAVIQTPTGVWIWVGTIPSYLAECTFETEQAALDAYTSIDPCAEIN